jgi:hypothetical protein
MINITEQIRMLAAKLDLNMSEMAAIYGNSPQAYIQKVKRGTFYPKDLNRLCQKLGIDCELKFILKGDKKDDKNSGI